MGTRVWGFAQPYWSRYKAFVVDAASSVGKDPWQGTGRLLAAILLAAAILTATYLLVSLFLVLLAVVLGRLMPFAELAVVVYLIVLLVRKLRGPTASGIRVTQTTWDQVLLSLDDVDLLSGDAFEGFVGSVFERLGYQVTHTKMTRDFGADLVLVDQHGQRQVVQTKKRTATASIGVDAVQEVIGSLRMYSATSAMVVCNCRFTSAARELACVNGVELLDRDGLARLLNRANVAS